MLDKEWQDAIAGFIRLERAGGKPETTCRARREHLQHLARRVNVGPWAVTGDMLLDYVSGQDWAQETRRGRRTTMTRFYQWGVDHGRVDENPAEALPHVKIGQGRPRPAPDRVYREALMAAAPREQLMLRLAAEVGMRRAEVAVVHTDDLVEDLVGWSLVVHGKGNRERVVPLPSSLGRQLADAPKGYVFPGADEGHLSPRYVGKLMVRLLPDGWTMHTLRHRFATRAYALRSDILLVQKMLGHSSPATTQRYVEYDRDRMRAVVDELAS